MVLSEWPCTALIAVPWALGAVFALVRLKELQCLGPEQLPGPLPPVTLCIPARNEAPDLAKALDSWLAQEHPGLRILVVDDGSTDATPAILAEREKAYPGRLRVLRNEVLPPGWLGKNHALDLASRQREAQEAAWLLFVDADVQAPPDLLRRAFAYLDRNPAALLALLPAIDTASLTERAFLPWVTLGFLWVVPFRKVPVPGSWAHCGVGAFTLVRRAAYDAVDGHAGAPMDPIDDMMLAKRVKAAGFTNRVALAGPGLHLRMYHGLGDLIRAMRKNALAFPILVPLAPLSVAAVLAASLGPVLLALAGHLWPGVGVWALVTAVVAIVQRRFTGRRADWAWMLWPVNGFFMAWGILWTLGDRVRGVNHWRGREVRL